MRSTLRKLAITVIAFMQFVHNGKAQSMVEKINQSRNNFNKLGVAYPKANGVVIKNEIIEGVNCFWLHRKENNIHDRVIIYLHGGCFALGSIESHGALVSHLAKELTMPILFIEYRLAPEHPYPAAQEDILNVYKKLINMEITDITFMGDSAGGALALSVISMLNKEGYKQPHSMILISPWIDLSCTNEYLAKNADIDPILSKETLLNFVSLYKSHNGIPSINPIENMYGVFPPTLILVGSNEILLGDSKLLFTLITKHKSEAKLSIYGNKTHVWLLDDIQAEESKEAITEIRSFLNKL